MNGYVINSCGISDCPPEWSWVTGDCGFDDYDLWAVFRGHGEISVGGQEFAVSAGACVILPPGKKITAFHDPCDPLLVIHVHFSPDGKIGEEELLGGRCINVRDVVFFRDLLDRVILYYYRSCAEVASMWLSAALSELLSAAGGEGSKSNPMILEICDRINSSLGAPPSLSELAKNYGYSEAYLGKLFKKAVGIEFSAYAVNARINKAKILLRSSDYSVGRIAEMLGYCDSCFFVKQFTKIAGVTPGRYRRL